MQSLGKVTVTTAATAVQLTTSQNPNYTGKIRVTAVPANTGLIYVGVKGIVGSTGVGVLAIVGIPTATGPVPFVDIEIPGAQGGVPASALWLDTSVNGSAAIVAVL